MSSSVPGHSGSVREHRRVLRHQGPEEGRHHRQGRGRVALGRETHLRGGKLHETPIPGQHVRLLPGKDSFPPGHDYFGDKTLTIISALDNLVTLIQVAKQCNRQTDLIPLLQALK